MKIYYDLQFEDEGAGPQLIAIGAVSADGRHEFHADLGEGLPALRALLTDWLSQFPGCWLLADSSTNIQLLKQLLTGESNAHHGVLRLQPTVGRQFSISLFQPQAPSGAALARFEAAREARLDAQAVVPSVMARAQAFRAAVLAAEGVSV